MPYDIKASRIGIEKLAEFISSPIDHDIDTVPGIGPTGKKALNEHGVTSTYQLIGAFLACVTNDKSVYDIKQEFWELLETAGVPPGHRSTIVVALSEKIEIAFPQVFQPPTIQESE